MTDRTYHYTATKTGIKNNNYTLGTGGCNPFVDIIQTDASRFWVGKIDVVATERNTFIICIDNTVSCEIKKCYRITVKRAPRECCVQGLSHFFSRRFFIGEQRDLLCCKHLRTLEEAGNLFSVTSGKTKTRSMTIFLVFIFIYTNDDST
ncbi:MAG: hypothetical protein AUI36_37265 [Cyanobacteria bacterium 13_1_40CM_2_61_4]|nr:MAG: hypothetical protein AUI36_37265 [Cyanobacteria bacterium 13_1_40CM_2_61_4]